MTTIAQDFAAQAGKPVVSDPFPADAAESSVFQNTSFAQVLINYWQAAIRWKWLIVGIVAVCVALGIVATMLQPRLFTASSELQIDRGKRNITNVVGIEQPSDSMGDEFYNTQYALLKSRSLAERVAHSLKLGENPDFLIASGVTSDSLTAPAKPNQPVPASLIKQRETMAAGILMGGISIHPQHKSSLVDISWLTVETAPPCSVRKTSSRRMIASRATGLRWAKASSSSSSQIRCTPMERASGP